MMLSSVGIHNLRIIFDVKYPSLARIITHDQSVADMYIAVVEVIALASSKAISQRYC